MSHLEATSLTSAFPIITQGDLMLKKSSPADITPGLRAAGMAFNAQEQLFAQLPDQLNMDDHLAAMDSAVALVFSSFESAGGRSLQVQEAEFAKASYKDSESLVLMSKKALSAEVRVIKACRNARRALAINVVTLVTREYGVDVEDSVLELILQVFSEKGDGADLLHLLFTSFCIVLGAAFIAAPLSCFGVAIVMGSIPMLAPVSIAATGMVMLTKTAYKKILADWSYRRARTIAQHCLKDLLSVTILYADARKRGNDLTPKDFRKIWDNCCQLTTTALRKRGSLKLFDDAPTFEEELRRQIWDIQNASKLG